MKITLKASEKEINEAKQSSDGWDYLFIFTDEYFDIMSKDPTGEVMREFNAAQHTLIAYNYLYGEVSNGGFVQLIQNGYGGYIFNNPFSEHLRELGAVKIADIVDKAKQIYVEHKDVLESETTLEGFSNLYKEYPDFEPLDDEFYSVMDAETVIIRNYVAEHFDEFIGKD